ncbi:MAG: hypothetical protein HYX79_03130 [Chloroflexi bacterium]|nr:hypothetical protein [Chloroflexota bacterium]
MATKLEGRCRTTAMGIMPHTDIDKAIDLALTLDIPFWPQLPRLSYYQDNYAQTAQNFPGISLDLENKRLRLDTARFQQELSDYAEKMALDETFALTGEYATVFDKFLARDLSGYYAVRGHIAGPISFGFNVTDEERRPIIYNEEVKGILFDFMQRKVNVQCRRLKEKNPNAFVWIDEPGLTYIFNAMYGYNDQQAKADYKGMLEGIEGLKALHLCPNVNLPYLFELGVELVSFDAYQIGGMPKEYAISAADFLKQGGVIGWGMVTTESALQKNESADSLAKLTLDYWEAISRHGNIPIERIAEQALLAPARCCVRDLSPVEEDCDAGENKGQCGIPLEERNVNKAFTWLREISAVLKHRYHLE